MNALAHLRTILWTLVVVAAVGATGLYAYATMMRPAPVAGLGHGDYQLSTHEGAPFTRASFNGNPSMLFFGFTHCPEVCPTTLFELNGWLHKVDPDGTRLNGFFVSVDPERDTPELLGQYISNVTDRVKGISGPPEKVNEMIKGFKVYAKKVPVDEKDPNGDYTMDHTASVFLLDDGGRFAGTIAYGENPDVAVQKLENLIKG